MNERGNFSPYAGRVYRNFATLIPSQNLMDDLAASPENQETLKSLYYTYEGENTLKTPIERVLQKSEDQIVQEEIDAKFRPAFWRASRYSDGSWAVLYAAESEETALREVLFHIRLFYREELRAGPVNVQRRVVSLLVDAACCRDIVEDKGLNREALLSKDESGYPYCQILAKAALENDAQLLRTPSARHSTGVCTPIFDKSVVAKDEGHLKYLMCALKPDGSATVTGLIEEETKTYYT